MAFVRSPRGTKKRFSVAKVAASISESYVQALGAQTTRWRKHIQGHAITVHEALKARLGEANGVEWSRQAIRECIEQELRRKAPAEVHEAFLELHPVQGQRKSTAPDHWDRFEGMTDTNPDAVDPVWEVFAAPDTLLTQAATPVGALETLGDAIRSARGSRPTKPDIKSNETRRSDWLKFWRQLSRETTHALDFELFERRILKLSPDQKSMSSDQWWSFWQEQVHASLRDDPRLVGLLRVVHEHRERARVCGQNWLEDSGLLAEVGSLTLSFDATGNANYKRLWIEHIAHLANDADNDSRLFHSFDIKRLALALEPSRDRLIDWRGVQWLATVEGLWPLAEKKWKYVEQQPHPAARELPQWAFMRLAMAMAMDESDPTTQALAFYEEISSLALVPSETMIRESGRKRPRYLEDEAGRVHDRFEAIHDAMHQAAVGTKWTGTVALDWRDVRAQGAPIAGRRLSQGPVGFIRSIDLSLAAQGRIGDDRPVTVCLPLWHRDAESFLDLRQRNAQRMQVVIVVPDLFFERLQAGTHWSLIDPAAFPDIVHGGRDAYLAAEAAIEKKHPGIAIAQRIPAERLWRRLVKAMTRGSPFVTFEDANLAFTPFPNTAPGVPGLDGVGALPVPLAPEAGTTVAWPSMAVDLSKTLDNQGNPDPERMRKIAALAMRMLDNAIDAAKPDPASATARYRPVCLGAVGFFEAVNRGSASAQHDPDLVTAWVSGLAEAWSSVVNLADQQLRKERGAAPAWESEGGRPFDPLGAIERLKISRQGSIGHRPTPRQDWNPERFKRGHRCSVRTLWAPYQGPARIAGVTPGGIGTLRPVETMVDEEGQLRWVPTPLLMGLIEQTPEELAGWREVLRHPTSPKRWPAQARRLAFPEPQDWEVRLTHAAHIRPWVDQGVSLTLPAGLPSAQLATLVRRAWWLGLSNVRFEGELSPGPVHEQEPSVEPDT